MDINYKITNYLFTSCLIYIYIYWLKKLSLLIYFKQNFYFIPFNKLINCVLQSTIHREKQWNIVG